MRPMDDQAVKLQGRYRPGRVVFRHYRQADFVNLAGVVSGGTPVRVGCHRRWRGIGANSSAICRAHETPAEHWFARDDRNGDCSLRRLEASHAGCESAMGAKMISMRYGDHHAVAQIVKRVDTATQSSKMRQTSGKRRTFSRANSRPERHLCVD